MTACEEPQQIKKIFPSKIVFHLISYLDIDKLIQGNCPEIIRDLLEK
jgi:hypothetical protein